MKIKEFIKKNYVLIIISALFIGIMTYTSIRAPYASDDYPYSLFYRGTERITNIIQIAKNQIADYRSIAGRIVTNGLGQLMLMFPRGVFSICNAIVTLISSIFTYLIIKEYSKNKKINVIILPLIMTLFFMMDPTKYLVYWIMGSTNYIWTAPLLLIFIWYVKKYGMFTHPIITGLYMGAIASFHESLLVFFIIYLISHIILDKVNKEKLNKYYWFYIIMIVLASIFIFVSPGNRIRNATWYPEWNNMGLLERLMTSIPTVAKNMFGVQGLHNLIPLVFMVMISISLLKKKDSLCTLLVVSNIALYIMAFLLNDGWLYLLFSIILFISESYNHIKEKNYDLIVSSISFYAIVYSMIITPEYAGGRPNYFMYWYMIIIIGSIVNSLLIKKLKYVLYLIIIITTIIFAGREVSIYTKIGKINDMRNAAISATKENGSYYLYFRKMPDDLAYFSMEANTPGEENYWAKKYFISYYGLSEYTYITLVD